MLFQIENTLYMYRVTTNNVNTRWRQMCKNLWYRIYLEIHIININYYIILGLFTWYQYSTVKTDSLNFQLQLYTRLACAPQPPLEIW